MQKIRLVDSVVIVLPSGPQTIHQHSPIFSRILAAETPEQVEELLALRYDEVWEAYDVYNYLGIVKVTAKGTDHVHDYIPDNILRNAVDSYTLLGRFLSKDELLEAYPEYFI